MTKIKGNAQATIEFTINFTLTQQEASALEAIAGYGADNFLKVFYPQMGKSYLEPYEKGMRDLFARIKSDLPTEIAKINTARKAINEALKDF
jgi:hypothetical protein